MFPFFREKSKKVSGVSGKNRFGNFAGISETLSDAERHFIAWGETRGLYAGQWIYICGWDRVCIVNMNTLQAEKTVFFGEK